MSSTICSNSTNSISSNVYILLNRENYDIENQEIYDISNNDESFESFENIENSVNNNIKRDTFSCVICYYDFQTHNYIVVFNVMNANYV